MDLLEISIFSINNDFDFNFHFNFNFHFDFNFAVFLVEIHFFRFDWTFFISKFTNVRTVKFYR